MSQEKEKVNTYIVENDNNVNLMVYSDKVKYCVKCGRKLGEDSLDRFCDDECRRNYYIELRRDNSEVYNNVF